MKPPGSKVDPKVFPLRLLDITLDALASKLKRKRSRGRVLAARRRRRSGRGIEGRAHQAASRSPRSRADTGCEVQVNNGLFTNEAQGLPPLTPTSQSELQKARQKTLKSQNAHMKARSKNNCPKAGTAEAQN